jgi:hypothetical protein
MASTTFSGPVTSTNGFVGAVTGAVTGTPVITPYIVSALPLATAVEIGTTVYVTDAATNATLATSDGTIWRRADTGAVVS